MGTSTPPPAPAPAPPEPLTAGAAVLPGWTLPLNAGGVGVDVAGGGVGVLPIASTVACCAVPWARGWVEILTGCVLTGWVGVVDVSLILLSKLTLINLEAKSQTLRSRFDLWTSLWYNHVNSQTSLRPGVGKIQIFLV